MFPDLCVSKVRDIPDMRQHKTCNSSYTEGSRYIHTIVLVDADLETGLCIQCYIQQKATATLKLALAFH